MGELDELRSNISMIAQTTTKMVGDLNIYQDTAIDRGDRKRLYERFALQRRVIEACLKDIDAIIKAGLSE